MIYNTYIYIYLLKTRLMRILKFTRQLVKPRCKRKVSIYLIYRINFLSTFVGILKMQGVDRKSFVFFFSTC